VARPTLTVRLVCLRAVHFPVTMAIDHEDKDGIQQVLMYDAGIGTGNAIDKQLGGALGEGIDINILELYTFLALNYQVCDPCKASPTCVCAV
jgi:Uncharacterized alpha/beta hydrolase domain (DUF2235)